MGSVEYVGQLVALGLTKYEASAYLGLLRRDALTAAELSRLAGVPRQRIYDVLDGLIEKGLASARPGEVMRYTCAAPTTAVDLLVGQHRQRLADLERQADQVAKALRPAYHEGRTKTDPLDYIEVLRYPGAIGARFAELLAGVRREMLVFSKPPYVFRGETSGPSVDIARAHRIRTVYERSVFDDPALVRALDHYIAEGEQTRFVDELPLKLGIIDETTVMFGMPDPVAGSAGITTMVIEHPALARSLKLAFEATWAGAATYDEAAAASKRPE